MSFIQKDDNPNNFAPIGVSENFAPKDISVSMNSAKAST